MSLKFYNTLTRKDQVFKPIVEGYVGMYTCGPTVYNYPHIGNYRAYVCADILKRYLEFKGFKVKQVMNLTDVDDKTIRDSQKEGVSLQEFTERYAKAFFEDLKSLNVEPAGVYPKATEHIQEMIDIIEKLVEKGFAYIEDDGSVYYKVGQFKKYGQLANINLQSLEAGASGRVKKDEYEKENVGDFALWKAWTPEDGAVFWETKFKKGRPGWHIECSAMSMKYLGSHFDIHTGGIDLVFPHHQNEIAQSEPVSGETFVNYWIHNEWLLVNGQKMSKSLENFFTLRDILAKGYLAVAVRYLLLSTHYRQQLNFTFEGLDAAKNSLQRIWDFVQKLDEVNSSEDNLKVDKLVLQLEKKFEKALDNDLEISEALSVIFVFIKHVNVLLRSNKLSSKDAQKIKSALFNLDKVLGVIKKDEETIPSEILVLVKERDSARVIKNFALSDEIRDEIKKQGYVLEDSIQGTRVKKLI